MNAEKNHRSVQRRHAVAKRIKLESKPPFQLLNRYGKVGEKGNVVEKIVNQQAVTLFNRNRKNRLWEKE